MAPSRNHRGKYHYSEETLTVQKCQHCGKVFKPQGFKKHETSCKHRQEVLEEQEWHGKDFEKGRRKTQKLARIQVGNNSLASGSNTTVSQRATTQRRPPRAVNEPQDHPRPHDDLRQPDPNDDLYYNDIIDPIDDLDAARIGDSEHNMNENMSRRSSDVSMASMLSRQRPDDPPISFQRPTDFKTEYHPRSMRPPLCQKFEEFRSKEKCMQSSPVDSVPWRPFRTRGDHAFAEIALRAGLNKSEVDGLLSLISLVSRGEEKVTLKNEAELRKTCDDAGAELTPFSKDVISTKYKSEVVEFDVHTRPIWDWALDLLANPELAPHFVWDAERVYKHDGTEYERFYDEPWTGDRWWDIQSRLPENIENAVPFGFILYADKTRLSSHGSVKGYPVIVRCANLPVEIRNSQSIGGGCVVGWLPIVPEDAAEEGKLGYTTLKRVVWHEAFTKLLEAIIIYSKTGYQHKCWDEIIRYLFPLILILSGDYEEQCMMSLIRGRNGKCPCPVCLVPLEELHDLAQTFGLRNAGQGEEGLKSYKIRKSTGEEMLKKLGLRPVENVFWLVRYSDPHDALSFDRLHYLHLGVWGKHLLGELKSILKFLGRQAEATVEGLAKDFPRWRKLSHFKAILNVTFSDGNKLADLSIQVYLATLSVVTPTTCPTGHLLLKLISTYLELDSLIGLDVQTESTIALINAKLLVFNERLNAYVTTAASSGIPGLREDWDFPKIHLWKHIVRDIRNKGVSRNYSTRPNEKMHGPLKHAYQDRSNGRDVAGQILRVDQHVLACKLLRDRIDQFDQWCLAKNNHSDTGDDNDGLDHDQNNGFLIPGLQFEGHFKFGSPCRPETIQEIEGSHNDSDRAFVGFRKKFTEYLNNFLPSVGHQLTRWISIPQHFKVREYRYLKVNYESSVDWRMATDYIRCTPQFFDAPRYDCALIQLEPTKKVFVRLIFIFTCQLDDIGELQLALVQPYTASIANRRKRQLDNEMSLTRVRAVDRTSSIFIPVASIIRGALLFPDPAHKGEFLIVDHIDGDMYLRMREWRQGGN